MVQLQQDSMEVPLLAAFTSTPRGIPQSAAGGEQLAFNMANLKAKSPLTIKADCRGVIQSINDPVAALSCNRPWAGCYLWWSHKHKAQKTPAHRKIDLAWTPGELRDVWGEPPC